MNEIIESLEVDEFGRVLITDPELLELINGAQGSPDLILHNGACSNGHCS